MDGICSRCERRPQVGVDSRYCRACRARYMRSYRRRNPGYVARDRAQARERWVRVWMAAA